MYVSIEIETNRVIFYNKTVLSERYLSLNTNILIYRF